METFKQMRNTVENREPWPVLGSTLVSNQVLSDVTLTRTPHSRSVFPPTRPWLVFCFLENAGITHFYLNWKRKFS